MAIDFSKTAATSRASGFQNYAPKNFSGIIPAQVLAANAFVTSTASTSTDGIAAVSQIQTRLLGFNPAWRVLTGTWRTFGSPNVFPPTDYQVQLYVFRESNTLKVLTLLINQSGGNLNIPEITTDCRAYLFIPPFEF